jgi:hypothetical protein
MAKKLTCIKNDKEVDTIADNVKRKGRPSKNKNDTQPKSVASLSPEQKRVYDFVKLFKKLDGANPIIETRLRTYTDTDLERILADPVRYYSEIADLCNYCYTVYGFFRELIQYYVEPTLYRWTVNTKATSFNFKKTKADRIERDFIEYISKIGRLNFGRELRRVLLMAHLNDAVCAYWLEDNNSSTLWYVPNSWCVIKGKANGNWIYKIDSRRVGQRDLDSNIPKEIVSLINRYKGKSGDAALVDVPLDKSFCIKYADYTDQILPPFTYVIELVVNLKKIKALGLLRSEQDVINLIEMLIPINDKDDDHLLFTDPIISQFAMGVNDLLGNDTTVLPTPMKLSVLPTSKTTATENNNVAKGITAFGEETGMPSFGGANSLSEMTRAIENASSKVFSLLDQISSVINLKMKAEGYWGYNGYDFAFEILHMNEFNKWETQENLLKQAQFGAISKFEIEAARGRSPDMVLGQNYIENVLYRDMWASLISPSSSHTQAASGATGSAGRPTVPDDNLSPAGEQSREGGNDSANRAT